MRLAPAISQFFAYECPPMMEGEACPLAGADILTGNNVSNCSFARLALWPILATCQPFKASRIIAHPLDGEGSLPGLYAKSFSLFACHKGRIRRGKFSLLVPDLAVSLCFVWHHPLYFSCVSLRNTWRGMTSTWRANPFTVTTL